MRSSINSGFTGRSTTWFAAALLLAALGTAGVRAEPPAAPPAPAPTSAPAPVIDPNVVPAGCAACGGGGSIDGGGGGCGCGSGCYPGRDACACCCGFGCDTACGRFLSDVYNCICCPDPCYEPHWCALADSAFFVDAARPITQTRLRYDHAWSWQDPDRAEFLMARQNPKNKQIILGGGDGVGKGLAIVATKADFDQFSLYTEGATGRIGVFVEMNYLSIDPTVSPAYYAIDPNTFGVSEHQSGFGDLTVGTKTLLLDCELMQFGFEFKTFIPTGNFIKGLGTGHVSLEPSLLLSMRLCPDVYFQEQMSYWIPLGGDALFEGNIYHNHMSLNWLLCRPCPGLQLIATTELNQWLVLGGSFTVPNFDVVTPGNAAQFSPVGASARGTSILSAGPGLRLVICDKIDIGAAGAFAITGSHFADQLLRVEFRWRF
jgi:hypothetical protein